MSARHRIQSLLARPDIWRAGRGAGSSGGALATGFPALDRALAGGWPAGVLSELLVSHWGQGEFRLLMPALAALSNAASAPGWVMLVNPPYIPYAPGLSNAGVDLSRVIVARGRSDADLFWTMEQALRTLSRSAVAGWCTAANSLPLRRLQLAAEAGGCWALLFRPDRFARQASPAALRLRLAAARGRGLSVEILKQRGGWPGRLVLPA